MISEIQRHAAISIIVPVYKVEAYLEECVNSILAQSFADFELLLVDDGSPDKCPELCEELAAKDSRIRVFHQANQGQAAARNFALRCALGEWVCFVDSDDAIHPQMLELLYREAQESGARIVCCDKLEGDVVPPDYNRSRHPSFERMQMCEETIARLYREDSPAYWCVWGKLIKKDIVVGIPMTPGRFYEDNAVMCQWLHASGKLSLSEEPLYFYRVNPDGTTKSAFSLKVLDFLWALQEQLKFYRRIRYRKMETVIAGRYLIDARYYHDKVLKELHEDEKAAEICRDMTKVFRRYQQRVTLPAREKEKLRDMLPLPLPQRFKRRIKNFLPIR